MKNEGIFSMIIQGQFWFVGRLVGGNKVFQPRIYRIIPDQKNSGQQLIQLEPFPHFPPHVNVGAAISYPILDREKGLIDLYEKVTSPEAEASYDPNPKKSNLVELKGGRSGVILPGGN